MGLGGFLAGESEVEQYDNELKREFSEIETVPATELEEVEDILIGLGVEKPLSKLVAVQISRDKDRWAEFMMKLELNMEQPARDRATKSAGTIALSYLVGGFIPFFPYIIYKDAKTGFNLSCMVTILALILFGYFKSKVTGQPIIKGTIKIALTGIIAAGAAFLLAKAVG
jgi:predicted membrane protein (TIGR00267 family)